MTNRTTERTVHFAHPFQLRAMMDEKIPAGTYIVETDEELIEYLSFPAYRRVATWLRIPQSQRVGTAADLVQIDPSELEEPKKFLC